MIGPDGSRRWCLTPLIRGFCQDGQDKIRLWLQVTYYKSGEPLGEPISLKEMMLRELRQMPGLNGIIFDESAETGEESAPEYGYLRNEEMMK